jgi:hypothetical protein
VDRRAEAAGEEAEAAGDFAFRHGTDGSAEFVCANHGCAYSERIRKCRILAIDR